MRWQAVEGQGRGTTLTLAHLPKLDQTVVSASENVQVICSTGGEANGVRRRGWCDRGGRRRARVTRSGGAPGHAEAGGDATPLRERSTTYATDVTDARRSGADRAEAFGAVGGGTGASRDCYRPTRPRWPLDRLTARLDSTRGTRASRCGPAAWSRAPRASASRPRRRQDYPSTPRRATCRRARTGRTRPAIRRRRRAALGYNEGIVWAHMTAAALMWPVT